MMTACGFGHEWQVSLAELAMPGALDSVAVA